jgi:hypothetical protein
MIYLERARVCFFQATNYVIHNCILSINLAFHSGVHSLAVHCAFDLHKILFPSYKHAALCGHCRQYRSAMQAQGWSQLSSLLSTHRSVDTGAASARMLHMP